VSINIELVSSKMMAPMVALLPKIHFTEFIYCGSGKFGSHWLLRLITVLVDKFIFTRVVKNQSYSWW